MLRCNTAAESETAGGSPIFFSEEFSSKLLNNIKGIIFDFDGTLFDTKLLPFYLIASNPLNILRIWKERLTRKRFAGCDYSSPEEYFNAFFTVLGKPFYRSTQRMQNWYFNKYMPRMVRVLKKHYRFRPGVKDLFRRFDTQAGSYANNVYAVNPSSPAENLRFAVYSDYSSLKERMEALGLHTVPELPLYGPESFGAQKPSARPFLAIAKDLGIAPEEVLVIGDRKETDGLGAFRAGMRFFCLETGRKRYFRLDPNRRRIKEKPQGPSLVMYTGTWDDLVKLLLN